MSRLKAALRHNFPGTINRVKTAVRRFARYDLGDIAEYPVCYSPALDSPARINLVVPVLSQKNSFGGVATAVRFFEQLRLQFPAARIIVTLEHGFEFEPHLWPKWTVDLTASARSGELQIVFLRGRAAPLEIGAHDFFVATHWTTAYQVKKWQTGSALQLALPSKPFVYFIQDFEPGFYAWSSEYLLADSTYGPSDDILAVFNTQLLHDYFTLRGYRFAEEHHFQPKLNPKLAQIRGERKQISKKKLILVYGRPSTARNAFTLLLAGLRHWAQHDPQAAEWTVLSLGEIHQTFKLHGSIKLVSAGKLSLEQYAQMLLDASVGCSLMVSPHPSYPPLEMAAFGVAVITNHFENKDLSAAAANIVSLRQLSPESLSAALTASCARHAQAPRVTVPDLHGLLSAQHEDEFPFIDALARRWLSASPISRP